MCFFYFIFFLSFGSISPCEVCVFFKKMLNVFQKQKKDKKSMLIPDFFFPRKISNMKTKYTKKSKSKDFFFIFFFFLQSVEKKSWDGNS